MPKHKPVFYWLVSLKPKLIEARYVEQTGMNVYILDFHHPETDQWMAHYTSNTRRIESIHGHEYLSITSARMLISLLMKTNIIPAPTKPNFRAGDPIPDSHPWRDKSVKPARGSYDPTIYRNRAKPIERDRVEIRLRDDVRIVLNELIKISGKNATEVITDALRALHRRSTQITPLPLDSGDQHED